VAWFKNVCFETTFKFLDRKLGRFQNIRIVTLAGCLSVFRVLSAFDTQHRTAVKINRSNLTFETEFFNCQCILSRRNQFKHRYNQRGCGYAIK
jgi:hypothetical protein